MYETKILKEIRYIDFKLNPKKRKETNRIEIIELKTIELNPIGLKPIELKPIVQKKSQENE